MPDIQLDTADSLVRFNPLWLKSFKAPDNRNENWASIMYCIDKFGNVCRHVASETPASVFLRQTFRRNIRFVMHDVRPISLYGAIFFFFLYSE